MIYSMKRKVALVVACIMCSLTASAYAEGDKVSVTINGETTYYTSIKDAVAKANESGNATITLLQDATTKERLDITNSATLDLNGNTLSCATYFADDYETMVAITTNNTKLTIIDSVGGGKLDGTGTDYALMLGEPGAYTARSASAYIDGSTVSGSVKTVSGTSMTVSGSTVESNSVVATIDMTNETTLNVFNSQILNTHSSSTASAIDNSGTLTITDSTVSGSIGVDNRGTANISGNTNITSTVCSVKSRVESQDSTLTITGGSYTGGIDISGGTATISGGSYTGGIVVSGGTATISDGTITESRSNKENAVEVSGSADLTISGGTFSAIAGETYDTGVYVHDGGTVKIIGGTITSRAYGVYNDGGSATITGGTISGGMVDLQVVGSDSILNLTLDEGKTVGATFPGGITAEGITLAELLATDTAAYWGVVDGKDTMLTVADDATGITDKGDITIRAKCDHSGNTSKPVDAQNGTHSFTCTVCQTAATEDHTLTDDASDNVITNGCSKCEYVTATATITATNATYDGTAQETATVAYGTGWTGDKNLTVTYANNVDAGTATASITIGGVTARTTFTIQPKEITGAAVAIEQGASFVYSGEPCTPAVSVTMDGKPLAASDYQVSYAGNVNAGQAMVTVTGRGNYSGSATATFTIAKAPAPTLPAATVSRNYAVTKVSVPTGIVAGEGSSVSVGTASGSGSEKVAAVALDAKGNLTFTLSGGANGDEIVLPVHLHSPNYEGPITATVTVTLSDKLDQRPLTVKATSTTVPSGGTLELSIGGGSGKGAVTYEVINGTGSASLSGSTLTGGAPGTVTVIATKEGTSQYNPARSQPLVITIE